MTDNQKIKLIGEPPKNTGSSAALGATDPVETSCCSTAATSIEVGEEAGGCCGSTTAAQTENDDVAVDCCGKPKPKIDKLLWGSGAFVALGYFAYLFAPAGSLPGGLHHFSHGVYSLMNTMWVGIALGIFFVGLIGRVPRDLVMSALGHESGLNGILRATGAGLLLDLCSHGILMVGMRLYERGASLGQVMAFLIASPWNSISLTIILVALIGLPWTLAFIVLSGVIAVVSGLIFERLTANGTLPANPNRTTLPDNYRFWPEVKNSWNAIEWRPGLAREVLIDGLKESTMILRWLLFGVVLAAAIRSFLSVEDFQHWFGPTLFGLGITLVVTTILEVCSEGSSPIAADILTRGRAPGNAFTFLMAGVATDYTEVMSIKERTKSWKIALFLPLVTVPQVILIGWLLNQV